MLGRILYLKGLQGQIEHDWLAGLGFSLSREFLDEKLRVNFSLQDILTRKFYGYVLYDNVDAHIISDWSRYNVSLGLVYNFGHHFGKKSNRSNTRIEEQSRIDSNN